jgi:hypothetical protein
MLYMNVDGRVYCRYALTPPIINSENASEYGIKVPWLGEPGQFSGPEVGRNIKLRIVVDGGKKKMTCHGKIAWFEPEPSTGQMFVGFDHLSLTESEFSILRRNFVEETKTAVEFGVRVRDKAPEAESITVSDEAREIRRMVAVDFPVSLLEQIDMSRGDTRFSEFVVNAVRAYLKR